jgi:hypothetical protein
VPVREAQRLITAREFAEWQAFYNLEPWGGEADDLRTALLLMAAGAGKGRKLSDLLPRRFLGAIREKGYDTATRRQSSEDMKRVVRGWSGRK